MVLPNSEGIPLVPTYSGYCSSIKLYTYVAITLYRQTSQSVQLNLIF